MKSIHCPYLRVLLILAISSRLGCHHDALAHVSRQDSSVSAETRGAVRDRPVRAPEYIADRHCIQPASASGLDAKLSLRLRGGGKPKVRLGGKPLPGSGYMGRVLPRSPRDPLTGAENQMIARAAKHRRKSTKPQKDTEGWFKKFVRQKQGLVDPKKNERPIIDTR